MNNFNWNKSRPSWDIYFMIQAEIAKLRSNCITRQVGSVIVKDNRQIATGYNGTPSGVKNCIDGGCSRCESRMNGTIKSGEKLDRCLCTHAEANAIMQCALFGNGTSTNGTTLYSTYIPCLECSKMCVTVGIKRIVILDDNYPEDGRELLNARNITIHKLNKKDVMPWIHIINSDKYV